MKILFEAVGFEREADIDNSLRGVKKLAIFSGAGANPASLRRLMSC